MSATVNVGQPQGSNPSVYPCTVGSDSFSIVASAATLAAIPEAEQSAYVQARALLVSGDAQGALAVVQLLATGSAANPNADPPTPDTRNWAALWVAGTILS